MSLDDEKIAMQDVYEAVIEMLLNKITTTIRENERQSTRLAELTSKLEILEMIQTKGGS